MNAPFFCEILSGNRDVRHRQRVDSLPIRIGRAYDNEVILDDPHISAHHAVVERGDDGGMVIRNADSRNGILHKRRRHTELPIDGSTVFKLGHVSLRVRCSDFQVADEIRDTTLHNWEGWPPALAGLSLIVCVAGLGSWFDTTEKFEAAPFLMAIVAAVCLGMVWCGMWAFTNRLFGGNVRLGRHLFILGCGYTALEIWNLLSSAVAYGLSWEQFTRYGSHGAIALFAVMVFFHLRNIKPGHKRSFMVASIMVALLCSGVKLMVNYRFNGILADELVMYERFPPLLRLSPDKPVTRLINDGAKLKAVVDRERDKTVAGDESDSDDQD
ncbi:MAG: FHA domain-containing protein [Desulfuromonadales bacterium]|nr:FHA domain-containing protein [Desulfuromonadales bacterium]